MKPWKADEPDCGLPTSRIRLVGRSATRVRISQKLGPKLQSRMGETMASEVNVERQFRFQCTCGVATVSGEKTVTCTGCGASLGIRRVRRHRQQLDSVAYYGKRTLPVRRVERYRHNTDSVFATPRRTAVSRLTDWFNCVLANCGKVLWGTRREKPLQRTSNLPSPPVQAKSDITSERLLGEGARVKVGLTRLDGKPHPHAGKTGKIARLMDEYSEPYWSGVPTAVIKLDSEVEPQEFVWVSLGCLEALPPEISIPRDPKNRAAH